MNSLEENKSICPLCSTVNNTLLEKVLVEDLLLLFEKFLKQPLKHEFASLEELNLYKCNGCSLYFFEPALTGSARIYEILHSFDWYYPDNKFDFDFAVNYIKQNNSVLDIGSGTGLFSKSIDVKSYVGLELSPKASLEAKKSGIEVLNETVEFHAEHHGSEYDVVTAFHVLANVDNPHYFIESALKCLKNGGYFIISLPSNDTFLSKAYNNVMNLPPLHVTRWSDKSLETVAEIFNLELVKLSHEQLTKEHRDFYAYTVIVNVLNSILGRKYSIVDTSTIGSLVGKLAWVSSKFYWPGLINSKQPYGHTVIAVYKKR